MRRDAEPPVRSDVSPRDDLFTLGGVRWYGEAGRDIAVARG